MEVPLDRDRIFLLIGILVFSNVLSIILIVYRERFAKHYNEQNFTTMISDFLRMDYDSIIEEGPSNILEKIATVTNRIYTYMMGANIQIWSSAIVAVVSIILAFIVNVSLGVVMLVYAPISYFGYKLLNKELANRSKQMQEETGKGFQELISYLKEPDYYKQLPDYEPILEKMQPSVERIYGSMQR